MESLFPFPLLIPTFCPRIASGPCLANSPCLHSTVASTTISFKIDRFGGLLHPSLLLGIAISGSALLHVPSQHGYFQAY